MYNKLGFIIKYVVFLLNVILETSRILIDFIWNLTQVMGGRFFAHKLFSFCEQ